MQFFFDLFNVKQKRKTIETEHKLKKLELYAELSINWSDYLPSQ